MNNHAIIPLLQDDEGPPEVRELLGKIKAAIGFVPNLVRLWANSPELLPALVQMETTICGAGNVPARLKELAAFRTSELNGCPYCKAAHGGNVQKLGYDSAQVAAVQERGRQNHGVFSEEEQAVLALADEMTLDVRARPETLKRVRELFGASGAIELMAVVSLLNFDNRMAYSADIPPDGT